MFGDSQTLGMGYNAASQGIPVTQATAKKQSQEAKETCVPVTIRSIEMAIKQRGSTGGELLFHGSEAGMLLLVGCVESFSRQGASLEFSLNDATGRIKARHYVQDPDSKALEGVMAGRYVSAFGSFREAPEPHFAVTGLRLADSADEVSYHMIEVAHAALKLKQGPKAPSVLVDNRPPASPVKATPAAVPVATPPATVTVPAAVPEGKLEGAKLKDAVLAFLKQESESRPEGVSVSAICDQLKSASREDVTSSLQALVDDGEIFTTIDDEHFSVV